jgi:hypothetical protein
MNPFEMVVLIVAIVMFAGVLKGRYGIGRDRRGHDYQVDDAETQRLRDEVKILKERVAVLERIATDSGQRLEQEIERLRDR